MTSDVATRQVSAPPSPLEVALGEIVTLREALDSRTRIGQAIGILMVEESITADAAFARLVEMSSHTNVKIRDIAAKMVEEVNARFGEAPSAAGI